jgi:hypothetical protein
MVLQYDKEGFKPWLLVATIDNHRVSIAFLQTRRLGVVDKARCPGQLGLPHRGGAGT